MYQSKHSMEVCRYSYDFRSKFIKLSRSLILRKMLVKSLLFVTFFETLSFSISQLILNISRFLVSI